MAKRKRQVPETIDQQPEGFVARQVDDTPQDSQPSNKVIKLRLTQDGTIDWDSMPESIKSKFSSAVANDPTALELIGLAAEEVEGEMQISEEKVKAFLEMQGRAQGFMLKYVMWRTQGRKLDTDIVLKNMAYKEEQLKEMVPPLTRIANRHIPEWYKKYGDYIDAVVLVGYYSFVNIQATLAEQEFVDSTRQNPVPETAGVTQ
jgi:hypothetical protein